MHVASNLFILLQLNHVTFHDYGVHYICRNLLSVDSHQLLHVYTISFNGSCDFRVHKYNTCKYVRITAEYNNRKLILCRAYIMHTIIPLYSMPKDCILENCFLNSIPLKPYFRGSHWIVSNM